MTLTCGAAMLVPLMVVSVLSAELLALVMEAPGANMNKQPPTLEKEARVSLEVVAPTVMAEGAEAGDCAHASPPLLLPAATTTWMLFCGWVGGCIGRGEGCCRCSQVMS
jgi:hypothetical protein